MVNYLKKGTAMPAEVGEVAPDFTLPSVSEGDVSLSQYRGQKYVVLSFHVFDFTSGWTEQAVTFRRYHSRLEERQAQVLGISCDHIAAHRAWATSMGGLPYPELSDWHPKGKVTQSYGLWNEERGVGFRAVIVVDKAGIVRFRQRYTPGTLPDPEEILKVVESLG
jgi:peroxiredoxin